MQMFDRTAVGLSEDWGMTLDRKQIQRWSEKLGERVVAERRLEVAAYERGHRPSSPANDPVLLAIGMDGGRVQMREKNSETCSRWREDKVGTVTSYLSGDGTEECPPRPLVTTYVGTMEKTEAFGKQLQVEAERRGLRGAHTVVVLGDGGNWIDPLTHRERLCDQRILDFYHAMEHLYEAAQAVWPKDAGKAKALGKRMKEWLWEGQVDRVIAVLGEHAEHHVGQQTRAGQPLVDRRALGLGCQFDIRVVPVLLAMAAGVFVLDVLDPHERARQVLDRVADRRADLLTLLLAGRLAVVEPRTR
jgi:hypothetical protein